jgi:bifunctional non-homologous end joining protein LigD
LLSRKLDRLTGCSNIVEFERVSYEGRKIRLSRLDKEIWPGFTKADLIKYYVAVSDFILPYLRERPLTLNIFPNGIRGKNIYIKNAPEYAPDWIERFPYFSESEQRPINYLVCKDKPSLVWLANLSNIEFHITLSRIDRFKNPDLMLFDLDPFEPAGFEDAARVALAIKDGLKALDIDSFAKTSGATGLHVLVGIERKFTFEEVRGCVRKLAALIQRFEPKVLAELKPVSERGGRVMIDFSQNSHGKTITAPYSLKPLPGIPASTPLKWEELERMDFKPTDFNANTTQERLKRFGDILHPLIKETQDLTKLQEAL